MAFASLWGTAALLGQAGGGADWKHPSSKDFPLLGSNWANQRYSALDQINSERALKSTNSRFFCAASALVQNKTYTDEVASVTDVDIRGDVPAILDISGVIVRNTNGIPTELHRSVLVLNRDGN